MRSIDSNKMLCKCVDLNSCEKDLHQLRDSRVQEKQGINIINIFERRCTWFIFILRLNTTKQQFWLVLFGFGNA